MTGTGGGSGVSAGPAAGRGALRAADLVDRGIAGLCRLVLLGTGLALLLVLGANVLARYLLDTGGFDWAQEVPERLFTWFIMAGVVLAAQQGGHVAVEWLPPRLPRGGRRVLLVAGHALVVFAFLMLAWQSMLVAEITAIEHSPVLRLPTSHGYYALAAGCVLLAVATFTIGLRVLLRGPEALPKPASEEIPTS